MRVGVRKGVWVSAHHSFSCLSLSLSLSFSLPQFSSRLQLPRPPSGRIVLHSFSPHSSTKKKGVWYSYQIQQKTLLSRFKSQKKKSHHYSRLFSPHPLPSTYLPRSLFLARSHHSFERSHPRIHPVHLVHPERHLEGASGAAERRGRRPQRFRCCTRRRDPGGRGSRAVVSRGTTHSARLQTFLVPAASAAVRQNRPSCLAGPPRRTRPSLAIHRTRRPSPPHSSHPHQVESAGARSRRATRSDRASSAQPPDGAGSASSPPSPSAAWSDPSRIVTAVLSASPLPSSRANRRSGCAAATCPSHRSHCLVAGVVLFFGRAFLSDFSAHFVRSSLFSLTPPPVHNSSPSSFSSQEIYIYLRRE